MSLCLSALVIMLLNYSKITTNAKFNIMVTLTRYYNYILHTCILPSLTKWYIPRFRRSAAQVQCIIVNCGTFTNMLSLAALEQPFQAAISIFFSDIVKIADLHAHNASQREALWACRSAIFTMSEKKKSFVRFLHRFLRFLGLDMAAWNGCSSAAKLGMLVNVPQLTIMHCTCAADLRNLGIYHSVKMGRIQVWRI